MIWMFMGYFTVLSLLFFEKDIKQASLESQLLKKVMSFSYFEIAKKCKCFGYEYSMESYLKQIVVTCLTIGVVCQLTLNDIKITAFISMVYACCIPFIYLQEVQLKVKKYTNKAIFSYLQTALMLLRENKTTFEILRICEDCVDYPINEDLHEVNLYIAKCGNISKGLAILEAKYPNVLIKNCNIVMRSKNDEGTVNEQLIDYFYVNVENYEIILTEFMAKWKANRTLFYLIIALNSVGILLLKNFLATQSNQLSGFMVMIIVSYYLVNLITIILYEIWCNRFIYFE